MNVRVGVATLLLKNNKILLGKRISPHGFGTWAPPGGHLDWFETPLQCSVRETLEETGVRIIESARGPWTNNIFENKNKHFITIIYYANSFEGEPIAKEPEKCSRWEWFDMKNLPQPLFPPFKTFIEDYPEFIDGDTSMFYLQ